MQIGVGYDFPFDVSVRLGDDIGGPSAGLMFSLGVYDTLTPGSLTGGNDVAGTGTIDERGRVGPIGGIQQKIVAAADAGAKIFLVPPANCECRRARRRDKGPDQAREGADHAQRGQLARGVRGQQGRRPPGLLDERAHD